MTKTMTATRCPHPTCGKRKARKMYACYDHWVELPRQIRDAIWAGYEGAPGGDWQKGDEMAKEFWKSKTAL